MSVCSSSRLALLLDFIIVIATVRTYIRSIVEFRICDREKSPVDFIEMGKALHKMKGTTAR